jgi:hypothetical protein
LPLVSAAQCCSPPAGPHLQKLLNGSDSSSALDSDHGDGEFPNPLGIFSPVRPLDWASLCVKDLCPVVGIREGQEDQTVSLLTAIEEDHYREACSNSRGRRVLLNLECPINYDSRRQKGKVRVS